MSDSKIQYISNGQGEVTGVILPIQLWRDILGGLEMQHLLKSDTMRQRLLEAKNRTAGIPLSSAITDLGLVFDLGLVVDLGLE